MGEIQAAPSAQEVRPLLVGSSVPALTYRTAEGAPFALHTAVVQRPAILLYFRGGW